jgi:pimeloyl-ACP methyl ester carboxylesterase
MTILILLAAAAVIALLITLFCYRLAFYSPDKTQENIYNIPTDEQYLQQRDVMHAMIRDMAAVTCQQVTITSRSGLQLSARYYHHDDRAPLSICVHGYRSTSIRDFCGGAILAMEQGHNVLLIDQRAHGQSQGHTITFGIRERLDCLDWIQWGLERFGADVPILLYGISMGGATVLMAAGSGLPDNVRGIIADSPYSSPEAIIRKVCRDMKYPPTLAMPFIRAAARLFGGFSLTEYTAAEAVKNASVPIMIIHGEDDRFVPCSMSADIQAANPAIRRHTFPDAGHGISYMKDTPRYHRLVKAFIAEVLK